MRLNKWNGSSWESVYSEVINNYLNSYKINSEDECLVNTTNTYSHKPVNYKKKEKTDMNERELMNKMKKGMRVDTAYGKKGTIAAFDYTNMFVGIMFDDEPSYKTAWLKPDKIKVIEAEKKLYADNLYSKPKRVMYDPEAGVTVVMWNDGEKTIVRASEGETLDIYDAFCAAFCKRVYGTNSALKRELNKILVVKDKKENSNA